MSIMTTLQSLHLQSIEFLVIIPISFGIILKQLPHLFSSNVAVASSASPSSSFDGNNILQPAAKNSENMKISRRMISGVKLWSTILLILFFILTCCESRMTPLISMIILALILSGYFIENEIAQLLFHIISTCSWIGCFDLYFRSPLELQFFNFFDMKWLVAVYLTTSVAMRAHLGQTWHLHSVPHMFVGIPILCLYYWGLEMPVCGLTDTSFFSCELMRSPPAILMHTELNDYYRIFGFLSIILLHVIFGQIMRSFLPDYSLRQDSPHQHNNEEQSPVHSMDYGRKRRSISGVESQREVNSVADRSVSTVTIPTSSHQRVLTKNNDFDSSPNIEQDETNHTKNSEIQNSTSSIATSSSPTSSSSSSTSSSSHSSTFPSSSSSLSSCDLSNFTSDILSRLPSILENSISASFWYSLASFQPNLLHSQLQFPSHPHVHPHPSHKTERSSSHPPQFKMRCSNGLHPSPSPWILRNPISHHSSPSSPSSSTAHENISPPVAPSPLIATPVGVSVGVGVAVGGGTGHSGAGCCADKVRSNERYRSSCSRSILDLQSFAQFDSSSNLPLSTLKSPSPPSTDVVGISEEEAVDIVQKGLYSCKTKRAH